MTVYFLGKFQFLPNYFLGFFHFPPDYFLGKIIFSTFVNSNSRSYYVSHAGGRHAVSALKAAQNFVFTRG